MLSKPSNRTHGVTSGHLKRTTPLSVLRGPSWEDRRNEDQLAPVAVRVNMALIILINYIKMENRDGSGTSMQLGVLWYKAFLLPRKITLLQKTGTEFW